MQHNGGTYVYPVCVTSASPGAPGLNFKFQQFKKKKTKPNQTSPDILH